MSTAPGQRKPKSRTPSPERTHARAASSARPPARRPLSDEAQETLDAIRAGQIDALVIHGDDSDSLYALRSFAELERAEAALRNAGAARRRSDAQLQALAEERERLFQDMHDGCIQSIYAVGLNLEACMRLIEADPKKAAPMIADAMASLNLVIQDLRSFINGRRPDSVTGKDLRTRIETAARAAGNRGLTFTVDIDQSATNSLTAEQAAHLLQIAREAISNATRHANARTGRVSLRRRDSAMRLEVSDDGTGFVAGKVNKLGLGLHHIDARARKLGGTARVSSTPNHGTRIVVEFGKT
jgi:signal transduction histidine kinase